jgi:hypothetical protein
MRDLDFTDADVSGVNSLNNPAMKQFNSTMARTLMPGSRSPGSGSIRTMIRRKCSGGFCIISVSRNENPGHPREELSRLSRERITFPLACFLVAAQQNCYLHYTWGHREMHGTFDWYPELDKPLGPPQGDATRTGWTYQREFAHASVFVDLETQTARIDWKR